LKTLALNILDIVQNSVRARAELITIEITESAVADSYKIVITDNGSGIPEAILAIVTDPFVTTRTKRRFGLGLSLMKYHAELTEGRLEINSEQGKGTVVTAWFKNSHLDRQPLGDIAGVIMILVSSNPGIEFIYRHITDQGEYEFSTIEVKEVLETDKITGQFLLADLREMIKTNLENIAASGIYAEGY
jgi:hypothetical protein